MSEKCCSFGVKDKQADSAVDDKDSCKIQLQKSDVFKILFALQSYTDTVGYKIK